MVRMRFVLLACILGAGMVVAACSSPLSLSPQAPAATAPAVSSAKTQLTPTATRPLRRMPTLVPVPTSSKPTPTQTPVASPTVPPTAQPAATATAEVTATPAADGAMLTVKSRTANVRSGPGTSYAVIGGVRQGEQFRITGSLKDQSWWQVDYREKAGWIAASVATTTASAADVPVVAQLPPTPAQPAPAQPTAQAQPGASPVARPPASAGSGRIVFARGNGSGTDVALLDVATGKVSVVANGRQPDIRSDGHIVFKGGPGLDNLYLVRPDGSELRQLSFRADDRYPQWAPTKQGILFSSRAEDPERVHIQWDISGPQPNTAMHVDVWGGPLPLWGRWPTWVSNTRMAYQGCDVWAGGSSCGIWTIDVDKWENFSPYSVTTDPNDRPTDHYGETLLYSSAATGNWEVYGIRSTPPRRKIDPKGTPVNLTNNGAHDSGATFSPDGQQIAFISNRSGWGIWVMRADGSNPRLLLAVPEGFGAQWDEERLSWGP